MVADVWDGSAAYEAYCGRWSRRVAAAFVRWLGLPAKRAWLDFGCGTGALTRGILAATRPRLVIGCDRSAAYVAFAHSQTADERARFISADLSTLPHIDGGFDALVSGLVLNFLPAPLEVLAAMKARARPGGVLAAYVWDYAEGMQMMRLFWDAACTLDPPAKELDEGTRFPLCQPDPLRQLFEQAGLREVQVQPLEVATVFRDFDDYWNPFLGGQGPAPGYAMSLLPERRDCLRNLLRSRLPVESDGSIALTARAWAAKGIAV